MQHKKLIWVVLLAGLALIGIVLTQTYWAVRSIRYQTIQFDNQVSLLLKGMVNRLYDLNGESLSLPTYCLDTAEDESQLFLNAKLAQILDSLLLVESAECGLPQDFEYLVFTRDQKLLFGKVKTDTNAIMASQFVVPITCIHKGGGILLAVNFPEKDHWIFEKLIGWIFLSVVLILLMLWAFYYIISMYFSQKKLSDMKADFVSNMTHELKTPIATISLSSEMLLKASVYNNPEKVKKYAALIFGENDRLKRQVEDVLQVASFEHGKISLKKEQINIDALLTHLWEIFHVYVEERSGIFQTRKLCSAETIFADYHHFTNLLSNLIDNAIKYSNERPQIRLEVKNYRKDEKDGLIFLVEDNGPGIPHRYQSLLFEKFYRIPTGDRHDVKGHGLGLYYVKMIAEAHGFKVWFKSQESKGTTFYVFVPTNHEIR